MPFYSDSDAYYANMRVLFACVQQNYPAATAAIGKSRMNIRVHTTAPEADVLIRGREAPVRITYGDNGVKPDLDIEMTADTFHRILLGELSLKASLGNGQMKVKGPIWKALSLGDLFSVSRKCYPGIIAGQGEPK
jgi:hypothetical protein